MMREQVNEGGEEGILLLETQNNYFNKCVSTLHLINFDLWNTALFRRLLFPTHLKIDCEALLCLYKLFTGDLEMLTNSPHDPGI